MHSLPSRSANFWIIIYLISISAFPVDWPHWTGPDGRNFSYEQNLPERFDRNTLHNVKWVTRLGEVAFGAPTVSNGRIYFGTNMAAMREDRRFYRSRGGVFACLDEATGQRL
ncbi:MAG: hypothetical protein VCB26_10385 [Candidatus Hydrogenedentota bacterium]